MLIGVAMVFGVMLVGPLTTQASPAGAAKLSEKGQPKQRVWLAERFAAMLAAPKVTQKLLDLKSVQPHEFGDLEPETVSN
jgi:hypothetical protein